MRRAQTLTRGRWLTVVVALAAAVAACDDDEDTKPTTKLPASAAAPGTPEQGSGADADVGATYETLVDRYEQLKSAYAEDKNEDDNLKKLRLRAQQLHAQMVHMRKLVGPGGQMHAPAKGGGKPEMEALRVGAVDEWHRLMSILHKQLGHEAEQTGHEALELRHRQIAEHHRRMALAIGSHKKRANPGGTGAEIYKRACAPCHHDEGEGVLRVFPPLAGSPVVHGPKDRLIRVMLSGIVGPREIGRDEYYGVMPAFDWLSDEGLAKLLTHIRSSWGNDESAVTAKDVAEIRAQHATRQEPYSAADLGLAPE